MKWRCKMNKQKMLVGLKQNFMLKRFKAEEKCEEFISKLCENKEFDELYSKKNKLQLQCLKTEIEEEKNKLNVEINNLQDKIDKFLKTNNIDKKNLQPQYDCKFCNDTGVFNGKICSCLLSELNKKISNMSSSQTQFKSFDMLNKDIMDVNDIKMSEWLKRWCSEYPNIKKININILGDPGGGKTFMLECVANEMINKNAVICYKTAFELNELARLYHIGQSYEFSDCLNADILLIDDLGTEPILKNVTKEYLYNLINVRQINNKPTFITSNLNPDEILKRYGDRIFSRLGNKNLSINIQLTSADKRI